MINNKKKKFKDMGALSYEIICINVGEEREGKNGPQWTVGD